MFRNRFFSFTYFYTHDIRIVNAIRFEGFLAMCNVQGNLSVWFVCRTNFQGQRNYRIRLNITVNAPLQNI